MPVIDLVAGFPGNYQVQREILDQPTVFKRKIDCSKIGPLAITQPYRVFGYEANTVILRAGMTCLTAEGTTRTISLYAEDGTSNALLTTQSVSATTTTAVYGGALRKDAAGYITLVPAVATLASAVFELWVELMKIRSTD